MAFTCRICIRILPNWNESSNFGIFFSEMNPRTQSLRIGLANLNWSRSRSRLNIDIYFLKLSWLRISMKTIWKIETWPFKTVENFLTVETYFLKLSRISRLSRPTFITLNIKSLDRDPLATKQDPRAQSKCILVTSYIHAKIKMHSCDVMR